MAVVALDKDQILKTLVSALTRVVYSYIHLKTKEKHTFSFTQVTVSQSTQLSALVSFCGNGEFGC